MQNGGTDQGGPTEEFRAEAPKLSPVVFSPLDFGPEPAHQGKQSHPWGGGTLYQLLLPPFRERSDVPKG